MFNFYNCQFWVCVKADAFQDWNLKRIVSTTMFNSQLFLFVLHILFC